MKRLLKSISILLYYIFAVVVSADSIEPVPYRPHIIPSENGQYYVKPYSKAAESVTDEEYGVAFQVREEMCDSVIWKVENPQYGAYMFLSNDGTSFICISGDGVLPFKMEDVALAIYKNGVLKRTFQYSDFIADTTNMDGSASFYYALSNISYDSYTGVIKFTTCDDQAYSVDTNSEVVQVTGRIWLPFGNFEHLEVDRVLNGNILYMVLAPACVILGMVFLTLLQISWKISKKWLKP